MEGSKVRVTPLRMSTWPKSTVVDSRRSTAIENHRRLIGRSAIGRTAAKQSLRKPRAFQHTRYAPGFTPQNVNRPLRSVVKVSLTTFVAESRRDTRTPGTNMIESVTPKDAVRSPTLPAAPIARYPRMYGVTCGPVALDTGGTPPGGQATTAPTATSKPAATCRGPNRDRNASNIFASDCTRSVPSQC